MIFIKMTCGLGNQMFMYAFARMLQEVTGQEICLDYSDFGNPKESHYATYDNTLKNFNIPKCKIISNRQEFIELTDYQGKEYYKLKRKLDIVLKCTLIPGRHMVEEWYQYDWNKKGLFFGRDGFVNVYPEKVDTEHIIAKGYWQSDKYFFPIRNIIKNELMVNTPVHVQNKQLINDIRGTESVAIHIRRGDYVKNNGTTHCTDLYYERAIKLIQKQKTNAVFYVFSDDSEYIKRMNIFPDKTIIVSSDNPGYEDLRLMYSCKNIVMSNSSFSWWAQYLSQNKDKIVVAPKPWFKRIHTDIYSNKWVNICVW